MKITRITDSESTKNYKSYIEADENERVLKQFFIIGSAIQNGGSEYGELFIPEGIEEIENGAFDYLGLYYHTFHFPRSLKALGEKLFDSSVKIFYEGSSEEFMKLDKVREESVCESDGYDHYPYYSGGSRWVTRYHSFDEGVSEVEVHCMDDGITLLYGKEYRTGNNPPKIKTE